MKKLFADDIYDILEYYGGFILVYRRTEVQDKVVVSYKSVRLDSGAVAQRTRQDYNYIKFGDVDPTHGMLPSETITCSTAKLDNGSVLIVNRNGNAKILNPNGDLEWQGTIKYKDCGPASIAQYGYTLWASFPERNALIRFNLRTMREELRIGGSSDSSFAGPEGLWVNEDEGLLTVCNSKANNILEVNMKTYAVRERASFQEPVHRYMRIGKKELVVLNSGLYLL